MARSKRRRSRGTPIDLVAVALIIGLLAGGIVGYSVTSQRIDQLQGQISSLQNLVSNLSQDNVANVVGDNTSLSKLYEATKDSVVMIQVITTAGTIQGSGFVYDFEGRMVIITNFHVINGARNITVTFRNGNAYAATVLGSDAYADLGVLSADAPKGEFMPLRIVSSSTLKVGDPVVAIGNPFGLKGSMTVGIVSQLGRTLREDAIGNYSIAGVIQTRAQINPGNSGGPLLNYQGQVVGITTAIISDSQGLGFAIPSNLILRELGDLVRTGSYNRHSWLGVAGNDMDYDIAKAMGTENSRGWLITSVISGGPADKAGLRAGTQKFQTPNGVMMIGGDIVIGIAAAKIVNSDDMLSYLEEYTQPGQRIDMTIVRANKVMTITVELGTRPPPT